MNNTIKSDGAVSLNGVELLDDPVLNKGTAFTMTERKKHGLEGLLTRGVAVEG